MDFNRFLDKYTDLLLRYRFVLLILVPLVSIGIGAHLDLTFNPSYRVFFGRGNPDLAAFDKYQLMFNKEDAANIIIDASSAGGVFTEKNLRLIHKFTERIRNAKDIPSFKRIMRVESISNYQRSSADETGIMVKDLVAEEDLFQTDEYGGAIFDQQGNLILRPLSSRFLKQIKDIALSEPATLKRLISEDANVTQVIVTFNIPDLSVIEEERQQKGLKRLDQAARRDITDTSFTITEALNSVIDEVFAGTDLKIYKAGVLYLNRAFTTTVTDDFNHINPLVFGLIVLVTVLLFQSFWPVVAVFSVIIFSILFSFGVAGLLEISLAGPNGMTFQILMAVGVADTIHILSTFYKYMSNGLDRGDAIRESIKKNFLPCLVTSITTAIGFFSIILNEVPPIRSLGWITGIGVLYAFIVTVLLVPALLAVLPIEPGKGKAHGESSGGAYDRLLEFSSNHRKAVAIGSVAVGIALSVFGFKLTAENDPTSYFKKDHEINVSIDFSDQRFTGMYLLEYALDTGREGGIKDPEFLRGVDRAKDWIERQEGVTHVFVLSDVVKRINRLLNEDDPAEYRIPDSRARVAEALFNYTSSLPMGLDIQNQKSFDDSALRLIISAREMSAQEVKPLIQKVTACLNEKIPMRPTTITGVRHIFNQLILRATPKMMESTFLALILITITLTLVFRSLRIGLISLIPNVIPITMVFGFKGLMGHNIDLFSGLVACLALGIVVDDTVHLLSRYIANRGSGLDDYESLRLSMDQCATPIIITTVILCFGFGIMFMSQFANNARLGVMTAWAIALALWFDLLVAPAAILLFSSKKQ